MLPRELCALADQIKERKREFQNVEVKAARTGTPPKLYENRPMDRKRQDSQVLPRTEDKSRESGNDRHRDSVLCHGQVYRSFDRRRRHFDDYPRKAEEQESEVLQGRMRRENPVKTLISRWTAV